MLRAQGSSLFSVRNHNYLSAINHVHPNGTRMNADESKALYLKYNTYETLISLNSDQDDFTFQNTDAEQSIQKYSVICEQKNLPQNRGADQFSIFKASLSDFVEGIDKHMSDIVKTSNFHESTNKTISGVAVKDAIELMPSNNVLEISDLLFQMTSRHFWKDGEINLQKMARLSELVTSIYPEENGFFLSSMSRR